MPTTRELARYLCTLAKKSRRNSCETAFAPGIALLWRPRTRGKSTSAGTASGGGNTRNYSEALRCVGVKTVDFNVRLVKRDSLLAISCVFSCF